MDIKKKDYYIVNVFNKKLKLTRSSKLLKTLTGKCGIYLLYNKNDKLLYIGKSKNLRDRIMESARERGALKFAYILVKNPADIHVLEPYLILKYKPLKNTEFMEEGQTSFELDVPKLSKIYPFEIDKKAAKSEMDRLDMFISKTSNPYVKKQFLDYKEILKGMMNESRN